MAREEVLEVRALQFTVVANAPGPVSYIGEYTGVSLDSCQVAAASSPAALQHCSMPPAAPSPLFSLVPCGDKGLGLVAETDLGPGTLLVSEAAVLRVTLFNGDLSSGASKDVSRQFSRYKCSLHYILTGLPRIFELFELFE